MIVKILLTKSQIRRLFKKQVPHLFLHNLLAYFLGSIQQLRILYFQNPFSFTHKILIMKNIRNYISAASLLLILISCNNNTATNSKKTADSSYNNGPSNKDRILPDTTQNHSSESGVLGTKSNEGKNNSTGPKK